MCLIYSAKGSKFLKRERNLWLWKLFFRNKDYLQIYCISVNFWKLLWSSTVLGKDHFVRVWVQNEGDSSKMPVWMFSKSLFKIRRHCSLKSTRNWFWLFFWKIYFYIPLSIVYIPLNSVSKGNAIHRETNKLTFGTARKQC